MNIGDSRVTHEPPDAERHVRVVWEEGSRKAPSYPILFAYESDEVVVLAIHHHRQVPTRWQ